MTEKIKQKYEIIPAALMVMIIVIIVYGGSLKNNFVDWDDYAYVVDNELVRGHGENVMKEIFSTPVSLNYHPITILSLRMNNNECKTCPEGISPKPFITGNIILHILNSLLVLLLIYLLTGRNIIASLLVALIFAVHPMHVESVAWIAERKDLLYSFFFLSGLITYLLFKRDRHSKYLWLTATFVLFVLSCLSKATAVVFPVVLLLMNFWVEYSEEKPSGTVLKRALSSKNLLILVPFLVVSVFFGIMAYRIQNNQDFAGMLSAVNNPTDVVNTVLPLNMFQKIQVAAYGFIMYIIKFFVPAGLLAFYPYPELSEFAEGSFSIILWLSLIVVVVTGAGTIWSMKRTKLFVFGIGFYFVTIALVLQFISVGNAIMANRYSYLPYIGLALIPALLISSTGRRTRNILLSAAGIFIFLLMHLSIQQVKTWKNTDTLWTNVIKKHPGLELARRSRGKYYSRMSGLAGSEKEKKILEDKAFTDFTVAVRSGTKSPDVFEGSAIIFNSRGDFEKALIFINKAISMNPVKGGAYYNRAMILDGLNEKEAAINDYSRALELDPSLEIKALGNRAVLYLEAGKYNEAKKDLNRLVSIDSRNYMYYYNRAFARIQTGDIKGAIDDYGQVLKLKPDDEETKKQLQILLDNSTIR